MKSSTNIHLSHTDIAQAARYPESANCHAFCAVNLSEAGVGFGGFTLMLPPYTTQAQAQAIADAINAAIQKVTP